MRLVLAMLLRHASSVAVRTALRDAVAALHKAKVPEAQASAEWLLVHALGESDRNSVTRAIATKRDLDASEQAQFSAFIGRRLEREPVQYIVGAWAFHDIELELEPEKTGSHEQSKQSLAPGLQMSLLQTTNTSVTA